MANSGGLFGFAYDSCVGCLPREELRWWGLESSIKIRTSSCMLKTRMC